jgi:hypothetical protein
VAQASFWRKQLIDLARGLADPKLERRVLHSFSWRRLRGSSGWLLCLLGLIVLLFWNWKLLLATVTGVGAMLVVYLLQGWNWQVYWASIQRFFQSSHRQFTLAVGGGGVAALLTYMAASIWADSENRWLAAGAIFQGLGTLLTLLLLGWQIVDRGDRDRESQFDRLLGELTQTDPLKRAIAVRQLTRLASQERLSPSDRDRLTEYFHFMLSRESEKFVREALIDGIHGLELPPTLESKQQPLKMPLQLERSASRIRQYR